MANRQPARSIFVSSVAKATLEVFSAICKTASQASHGCLDRNSAGQYQHVDVHGNTSTDDVTMQSTRSLANVVIDSTMWALTYHLDIIKRQLESNVSLFPAVVLHSWELHCTFQCHCSAGQVLTIEIPHPRCGYSMTKLLPANCLSAHLCVCPTCELRAAW